MLEFSTRGMSRRPGLRKGRVENTKAIAQKRWRRETIVSQATFHDTQCENNLNNMRSTIACLNDKTKRIMLVDRVCECEIVAGTGTGDTGRMAEILGRRR